jgi:hypothetical protein
MIVCGEILAALMYYTVLVERYLNIYEKYKDMMPIKNLAILTRVEGLFLDYIGNLRANLLQDFRLNVRIQLEKGDADLNSMHQALCDIREKTINEFEKREKGQHSI